MSMSPARTQHYQAIQQTKKQLEDGAGRPKQDKIIEWALLEIVESLTAIQHQIALGNLPHIK